MFFNDTSVWKEVSPTSKLGRELYKYLLPKLEPGFDTSILLAYQPTKAELEDRYHYSNFYFLVCGLWMERRKTKNAVSKMLGQLGLKDLVKRI